MPGILANCSFALIEVDDKDLRLGLTRADGPPFYALLWRGTARLLVAHGTRRAVALSLT